jgi:HUS1 checkpoint protein
MRWHAELSARKHADLQKLVNTLQKTGHKDCVLHMKPAEENEMTIALQSEPGRPGGSAEVWCALAVDQWFDRYEISSMSDDHIYLELTVDNLAQAMKAADKADHISLKLAKKPMPCISVELKSMMTVIDHTVPVDVWTRARMQNEPLTQPVVDAPDLLVWLPQLQKLYQLCERLAKIDTTVYISADVATSELSFRVETDTTAFTAKYKVKCKTNEQDAEPASQPERQEVGVDIKMLAKILNCYQVNCKHAVMGIMDEVILMQITGGSRDELKVTYYVPTLVV